MPKGKGPRNRRGNSPPAITDWRERCPLRVARMRAGLTQRDLAVIAHSNDVTIRILEQGAYALAAATPSLRRLAAALADDGLVERYLRWRKRGPNFNVPAGGVAAAGE